MSDPAAPAGVAYADGNASQLRAKYCGPSFQGWCPGILLRPCCCGVTVSAVLLPSGCDVSLSGRVLYVVYGSLEGGRSSSWTVERGQSVVHGVNYEQGNQ